MEKSEKLYGVRIQKKEAETLKKILLEKGLLAKGYAAIKEKNSIVFPLKKKVSKKELGKTEIKKFCFEKAWKQRSLKKALEKELSEKEIKELTTSFDVIGSIALIEIKQALLAKKKTIGKALLETQPQVKTVARVLGKHEGEFRLRPVEIIAGESKTSTIHKEAGCLFKVNVEKAYFSPRLSFERMRIAKKIKKGERIAAWFAGVGPFPIIFEKHSKMKKAIAVELNPNAFKLLEENIELNKCKKIETVLGDVRKEEGIEKFDRIVMPLPKGAECFLENAINAAKKSGIIHFYYFGERKEPFKNALEKIKKAGKACKRKTRIVSKKKVRSVSAGKTQVVIDFKAE